MQIYWNTNNLDYTSAKEQLNLEYKVREKLFVRILSLTSDRQDVNSLIDDLELCFDEKRRAFGICNIKTKSAQFLIENFSTKELETEFRIISGCKKDESPV